MDIYIRKEGLDDIERVREALRSAFPTDAESRLVDALRLNGQAVISLVVAHQDRVCGHIFFSPVSTTPPDELKGIGLAPVAVLPDLQSQGIGSALIREGLRICQQRGYDYCVVLGNPEYYRRFGLEKASQFGLQNEYRVDEEFMIIRFSGYQPVPCLVRYTSEFGLFSV